MTEQICECGCSREKHFYYKHKSNIGVDALMDKNRNNFVEAEPTEYHYKDLGKKCPCKEFRPGGIPEPKTAIPGSAVKKGCGKSDYYGGDPDFPDQEEYK